MGSEKAPAVLPVLSSKVWLMDANPWSLKKGPDRRLSPRGWLRISMSTAAWMLFSRAALTEEGALLGRLRRQGRLWQVALLEIASLQVGPAWAVEQLWQEHS
ncbi:uncharacterized protein VSU04_012073 [Chlamydotis macqueenii]